MPWVAASNCGPCESWDTESLGAKDDVGESSSCGRNAVVCDSENTPRRELVTYFDKCLKRVTHSHHEEHVALQPGGPSQGTGQGPERCSRDYRVARNSGHYGRVQG